MNDKSKADTPGEAKKAVKDEAPACGLIMPISATENHDEKHWASVQTLLHRGIVAAGMTPSNVWEGLNDRISKRIVSNIFRQDIVVADISDLNPNVMLELGLRLASKKPTVIVFNRGGRIPFDIGDVEAIPYPPDLNILEMEAFFEKFKDALQGKLTAYKAGTYEPYLGDVVVEVLEPQTKEVGINEIVLERLDTISLRIARLEKDKSPRSRADINRSSIYSKRLSEIEFSIPNVASDAIESILETRATSYSTQIEGDLLNYNVAMASTTGLQEIEDILTAVRAVGGRVQNVRRAGFPS